MKETKFALQTWGNMICYKKRTKYWLSGADFMIKSTKKLDIVFLILIIGLVLAYICGIFFVNFGGRASLDYDIYTDAMVAKYMAQEKTLFPQNWRFGNQIYVVATPVIASFLYPVAGDSYTALAMASCLMTILVLASFVWCMKPFVKTRSLIVGLLVLIGGVNIGWTAHKDLNGLQVFYTMASYYACYIIGIFMTLGVYSRYLRGFPVNKLTVCLVCLLNSALGMQSLRETCVLNLPLLAVVLLHILRNLAKRKGMDRNYKKSGFFAFAALVFNIGGVIFYKLLAGGSIFEQTDIIVESQPQLWDNIKAAVTAFTEFIGLIPPNGLFAIFRLAAAMFCIGIVVVALTFSGREYCRDKESVICIHVLFLFVSLGAVFAAGIVMLSLRPVYYFCWYLLVTVCVMYLLELDWSSNQKLLAGLKKLLVIGLICVSSINFKYMFQYSYLELTDAADFYGEIAEQLKQDEIRYVYTDVRSEQPMVATMAKDDIIYAPLVFSGDPDDLWNLFPYLRMDDWYAPENYEDAYILLSDETLRILKEEFSEEYSNTFLENLQLVHTFRGYPRSVYLYRGSEKMFRDMHNEK